MVLKMVLNFDRNYAKGMTIAVTVVPTVNTIYKQLTFTQEEKH